MEITKIPEFKDRTLTCLDCGKEFIFTEGEQRFFWAKDLSEPKRCKSCRMIRRRNTISRMDIEEELNGNNQS